MSKSLLSFLILLFLAFISNAQEPNCAKFKDGKFAYPGMPGKISLRKGNTQKSISDGKIAMLWKVIWRSECEYDLICKKIIDKSWPMKVGDKISVTIIATTEDCYTTSLMTYTSENPKGVGPIIGELCLVKN